MNTTISNPHFAATDLIIYNYKFIVTKPYMKTLPEKFKKICLFNICALALKPANLSQKRQRQDKGCALYFFVINNIVAQIMYLR